MCSVLRAHRRDLDPNARANDIEREAGPVWDWSLFIRLEVKSIDIEFSFVGISWRAAIEPCVYVMYSMIYSGDDRQAPSV
jgi:hypothetical protein